MAKKKSAAPFAVAQCSVCDAMTLTFGEQKHGGIRYCRDCIKHTLGWVQMTEEVRTNLMRLFDQCAAVPAIAKLMELSKALTPESLKAMAIGESRRRLFESGEDDGTEFLPKEFLR